MVRVAWLDLCGPLHHNWGVSTLLEELGGEFALRLIINDFVDRIFDDAMIGFMFRAASRERVKEMEFQFAAAHLGAAVKYQGQNIAAAHRKHPILASHFDRRLRVLEQVLHDHRCPPAVVEHWVRHTKNLRSSVVAAAGQCVPD